MSDKKYFLERWTTDHDRLIFDFYKVQSNSDEEQGILVNIIWKGNSKHPIPVLLPYSGQTVSLNIRLDNTSKIVGWMRLTPLSTPELYGVLVEFEYIPAGEVMGNTVEGVIVDFDQQVYPKPIPPDHGGNHTTPTIPDSPVPAIKEEQDLFPYLYLRHWPSITEYDLKTQFIQYQQMLSSPPSNNLYTQLLKEKSGPNKHVRDQMERTAQMYIDSGPDYIAKLSDLKTILRFFPEIWDRLNCLDLSAAEDIINYFYQFSEAADLSFLQDTGPLDWHKLPEYTKELDQVWQSYFALIIILGYRTDHLINLNKIIILANLLEMLAKNKSFEKDSITLERLLHASVLLPEIFPIPPYLGKGIPFSVEGQIEPYAIGDVQLVKKEFSHYEQGEIAYIENVMRGEKKEVIKRKLSRSSEQSLDDYTNNNDNSSQQQQKTLDLLDETILTLNLTAKYDNTQVVYGPPPVLKGDWTQTIGPDKNGKDSSEKSSKFARQILDQTLSRMNQKVRRLRSKTILDESEETVSSIFDNIGMDTNIQGIYRWLNKVYKARVINKENRLIVEFLIKDPASSFRQQAKNQQQDSPSHPVPPDELPPPITVQGFQDITPDNYAQLLAFYNVTDNMVLPTQKNIARSIQGSGEINIELPEGYQATCYNATAIFPESFQGKVSGLIGIKNISLAPGQATGKGKLDLESSSIPLVFLTKELTLSPPQELEQPAIAVNITCQPAPELLTKWQMNVYNSITQKYQEQLQEHSANIPENAEHQRATERNREDEKATLQNICLGLLLNLQQEKIGQPQEPASPPRFRVNEMRFIHYLQRLFNWEDITWYYSWFNTKGNGQAPSAQFPFGLTGGEQGFDDFLNANQVQIFLPVSKEMLLPAIYYLSSGQIWPAEHEFCPVNPQDAELGNELKKLLNIELEDRWQSEAWEVKVPTTMLVLNNDENLFTNSNL